MSLFVAVCFSFFSNRRCSFLPWSTMNTGVQMLVEKSCRGGQSIGCQMETGRKPKAGMGRDSEIRSFLRTRLIDRI